MTPQHLNHCELRGPLHRGEFATQLQQTLVHFKPQRDIRRQVNGEHLFANACTRPRHSGFNALTQALRQEPILP